MSEFFTKPRRSLLLKSKTTSTSNGNGGSTPSVVQRLGAIRRRSSSTSSTQTSQSSADSNLLLSAGGGNHSVSFADEQGEFATNKRPLTKEFVYESVPLDCHSDCFYTGEELIEIRREEVKAIKQALSLLAAMGRTDRDIESLHNPDPTVSWRGIEDYRDGKNRAHQARFHSIIVLREYKEQVIAGVCDSEMLRQVSKASSRDHRRAADEMGDADAANQGHRLVNRGVKRRISREVTAMTSRILHLKKAAGLPSFKITSSYNKTTASPPPPATPTGMVAPLVVAVVANPAAA